MFMLVDYTKYALPCGVYDSFMEVAQAIGMPEQKLEEANRKNIPLWLGNTKCRCIKVRMAEEKHSFIYAKRPKAATCTFPGRAAMIVEAQR